MSKRNALVKRLQAVEALGQAQIIAVDKTGTLTKNEMVVQKVYTEGQYFEIGGTGYEPKGSVKMDGRVVEPLNHPELIFAVKNAVLCTSARIAYLSKEKRWIASGDPTEAAIVVLSQKIGLHKNILEQESPITKEFPFDYKLRYRGSLRNQDGKSFLAIIGAPENLLEMSNKIWRKGKSHDFSLTEKNKLKEVFEKMSEEGLRVVALGVEDDCSKNLSSDKIKKVVFVGFFAMKDALRSEVPEAMKQAIKAGVRVVMITGDHKITARAIAREAGIWKEGDDIITGEELAKINDKDLVEKISDTTVFARFSPEDKLRIIEAFRRNKKIVAMTGDGVNDAPSLVSADLGVAMGNIGTEVAKEASDIVLLDDNFGNIVSAMEEGRSIYKTIKKVILYLFSTSIGEVLTIGGAIFLGFPLPVLPTQIIWLNFVTDGFLDVALATEPKEKNLLLSKFKKPNRYLIDFLMAQRMFFMAIPMMVGTLIVFKMMFPTDLVKSQTMSLVMLAIFQWLNAFNCRSEEKSIFRMNPLTNKFLVFATLIVVALQLLAVYNPVMQKILHTTPLSLYDWLLALAVALSIVVVEEIRKLAYGAWKKYINLMVK